MQSEYWVSDSLLISVHNSSPAGGAPGPVAWELCVVRAGYGLSQVDIYVDICARCCGVWGVAVVCVMLCGVYACVGVGVGGGGGPAHGHSLRSASLSLCVIIAADSRGRGVCVRLIIFKMYCIKRPKIFACDGPHGALRPALRTGQTP